jgi:heme oxygenase
MDIEKVKQSFARHWADFIQEIGTIEDTPEHREMFRIAIESAFAGRQHRVKGLGAVLAEHWEKFVPTLMSMTRSEETKKKLGEALSGMILQQAQEFSRILTEEWESRPSGPH